MRTRRQSTALYFSCLFFFKEVNTVNVQEEISCLLVFSVFYFFLKKLDGKKEDETKECTEFMMRIKSDRKLTTSVTQGLVNVHLSILLRGSRRLATSILEQIDGYFLLEKSVSRLLYISISSCLGLY